MAGLENVASDACDVCAFMSPDFVETDPKITAINHIPWLQDLMLSMRKQEHPQCLTQITQITQPVVPTGLSSTTTDLLSLSYTNTIKPTVTETVTQTVTQTVTATPTICPQPANNKPCNWKILDLGYLLGYVTSFSINAWGCENRFFNTDRHLVVSNICSATTSFATQFCLGVLSNELINCVPSKPRLYGTIGVGLGTSYFMKTIFCNKLYPSYPNPLHTDVKDLKPVNLFVIKYLL